MRIIIVYPLPSDKLDVFQPDIDRFFRTFNEFRPDTDYDLIAVASHHKEGADAKEVAALGDNVEILSGVLNYCGNGCDLGSHQFAAFAEDADLMVCCSTRVYFHRSGWLERIVDAFREFGPGLYGAMASFERSLHIRTCFYACRPLDFRKFPMVIGSRHDTFRVETGDWNLTKFFSDNLGLRTMMVTWDGVYHVTQCRQPKNVFRRGDQSNCLVFDKHTQEYAEALPERQMVLEKYAGDK